MSLFDDASLAMIPSAYKDGKLYSIKPTDGSGDFTFTRGSNLAATRVDVNGLIEKGRENLLLQSNSFDTSPWVSNNLTLTSGQTDKDGGTNAWLLDITAGTNSQRLEQDVVLSSIATFSIYAKEGTLNWVRLRTDGATTRNIYFDLENGVVGTTSGIDAKIEDVGNGWFKCSAVTDDVTRVRIYPADADGDVTHTSGNIYIQDAQLEQGLVATDYIETTTTTAQAGILEDMPRLDYSGGASCPSLLLEPQRSNIVTQSEALSLISATNSTITQNENVSPEGNQNGSLWTADVVTNGTVECQEQYSTSSGTTYTESWFVKYSGQQFVQLVTTSATFGAKYGNFDLINGIKGSGNFTDFSIEEYANGWYRISATETATSTGTGRLAGLRFVSSLTASRGGNVTTDGSQSIEIYGHQVEQGSYSTSLIPTYGTSQSRSQDSCNLNSIPNISTEFTFFVDFKDALSGSANFRIQNSSNIIVYSIYYYSGDFDVSNGTSFIVQRTANSSNGKIAIVHTPTSVKVFLNGADVTKSGAVPSGIDFEKLTIYGSTSSLYNIKQLISFPTALTDSECIALTTL